MRKQSSHSVKIRFVDKEAVFRGLSRYLDELKENHPEVEAVGLFGSYSTGDYSVGSDVDLLVILKDSPIPLPDRIVAFLPTRFPVGVDVFPYTVEELRRMNSEGNFWIKHVLGEVKWLHGEKFIHKNSLSC